MPASSTAALAPVTAISKYRVHVRDIATAQGWKLTQTSSRTDEFVKGAEHVIVNYGRTQVVSAGHLVGKTVKAQRTGGEDAKLQRVSTWLGVPMSDTKKWSFKKGALDELEARAATEIKVIEEAPKPESK